MVSITEALGKLKQKAKESIEREKLVRAKEQIAYKNAKASESKVQLELKKAKDLEREADRIEKAREAGLKAALPGHRKEVAKSIARGGLSFLKEHISLIPDRKPHTPKKRRMEHKKVKTKRASSTARRYT